MEVPVKMGSNLLKYACPIYLLVFQIIFIILMGAYGNYEDDYDEVKENQPYLYASKLYTDNHNLKKKN